MKETLKKAIDVLPEYLLQDAQSMMRRMVAAMQIDVAQDRQLANASYCSLLLKLSEADLVREFDLAIQEAMRSIKASPGKANVFAAGLSLSMTPIDDTQTGSNDDFSTSAALFKKICDEASECKIEGALAFDKEIFLAALRVAFAKARVGSDEVASLLPAARRALNTELVHLYGKLDS